MDIQVLPSDDFHSNPFVIKVAYNDPVENLLYLISLSITSVPITELELWYKGNRLQPSGSKLNQIGICHGESVELRRKASKCCVLL